MRLPWRKHHKDPTSGHWLDLYGNKCDKRSWRVPYIPYDEWIKKSPSQQVKAYEAMRGRCLNETGYDIATERKPPGWFPKGPLKCPPPSSGNPPCSPASTLDGLSSLRPPMVMPRFGDVPMMPTMPARKHVQREKIPRHGYCKWPACIARKVGVDERLANPKAKKACEAEWDKLLKRWRYRLF